MTSVFGAVLLFILCMVFFCPFIFNIFFVLFSVLCSRLVLAPRRLPAAVLAAPPAAPPVPCGAPRSVEPLPGARLHLQRDVGEGATWLNTYTKIYSAYNSAYIYNIGPIQMYITSLYYIRIILIVNANILMHSKIQCSFFIKHDLNDIQVCSKEM